VNVIEPLGWKFGDYNVGFISKTAYLYI